MAQGAATFLSPIPIAAEQPIRMATRRRCADTQLAWRFARLTMATGMSPFLGCRRQFVPPK